MKKTVILFGIGILLSACSDIIEVPDISNEALITIAPSENVTLDHSLVNFTWQEVADAERYHLQVAKPSFIQAQQIVLDTLIDRLNFNHQLEDGTFEWRVRAENSAYQTAYTTNTFTIEE